MTAKKSRNRQGALAQAIDRLMSLLAHYERRLRVHPSRRRRHVIAVVRERIRRTR